MKADGTETLTLTQAIMLCGSCGFASNGNDDDGYTIINKSTGEQMTRIHERILDAWSEFVLARI